MGAKSDTGESPGKRRVTRTLEGQKHGFLVDSIRLHVEEVSIEGVLTRFNGTKHDPAPMNVLKHSTKSTRQARAQNEHRARATKARHSPDRSMQKVVRPRRTAKPVAPKVIDRPRVDALLRKGYVEGIGLVAGSDRYR